MPFDKSDFNDNNNEEVNNNIIYFSESPDFSKNNIYEIDAAGQPYDHNDYNYSNKYPHSFIKYTLFGNPQFLPIHFGNIYNGGIFGNNI